MTQENFIKVGETYKEWPNLEWHCLAVIDGVAWLNPVGEHFAYAFTLSGEIISAPYYVLLHPNTDGEQDG